MTDINSMADIKFLVNTFYETVKKDDIIGYVFTDIASVDWEEHLPVMYSFWETVLFGKISYKGNPTLKHINLNKKMKLTEMHFERWINIWEQTIEQNFFGTNADNAKQKAIAMRELMIQKIKESNKPNFIQ